MFLSIVAHFALLDPDPGSKVNADPDPKLVNWDVCKVARFTFVKSRIKKLRSFKQRTPRCM
jgi:hypothetical protein